MALSGDVSRGVRWARAWKHVDEALKRHVLSAYIELVENMYSKQWGLVGFKL